MPSKFFMPGIWFLVKQIPLIETVKAFTKEKIESIKTGILHMKTTLPLILLGFP